MNQVGPAGGSPGGVRSLRPGLRLLLAAALAVPAYCAPRPAEVGSHAIRDGLGRELTLPAAPRRLVSLAPSVTESLYALGLGDRLVGVTDFCALPEDSGPMARVGGMLNPDLEAIRALEPDLLVGTTSGNDPSLASQAAGIGLPLYTMHTPDIDTLLRSLVDLSEALGVGHRGEVLAAGLRARLARVAERTSSRRPPRVLFIIWSDPLVVPGRPAFLTDALRRAGALSVTADAPTAHPAFDLETLIARAPEVILTTAENRSLVETLPRRAAWADVPAVRRGRIHVISGAIVRPGPGVVDGIEEIAALLHPQAGPAGSVEGKK